MTDATDEFFDTLSRRGDERLLDDATGTLRFDVTRDDGGVDSWFLVIRHGQVRVSRDEPESQATLRTTRTIFNRLVTGETHIYTSWMRTEVIATGEIALARLFQRLLPGPRGAHHPRTFARERRRQT